MATKKPKSKRLNTDKRLDLLVTWPRRLTFYIAASAKSSRYVIDALLNNQECVSFIQRWGVMKQRQRYLVSLRALQQIVSNISVISAFNRIWFFARVVKKVFTKISTHFHISNFSTVYMNYGFINYNFCLTILERLKCKRSIN